MAPRLAAALALLALIAVTSTAELGGNQPLSTAEIALAVMALAAGAMLAIGIGTVAYGGGYAIFGGNGRRTRRRTNLIAALLGAALLGALLALLIASIDGVTGEITTNTVPTVGPGSRVPRGGGDENATVVLALVAGGALVAALIVGLVIVLLARRHDAGDRTEDEDEAVIEAIDESLDDLRGEPDVRRAIIACYARMERALERAGSARRPAEAPFEYLVRVLERITANGPAARALTDLFERAKFSVEPMGEQEKQQAIGALELLRAEVSRPL
jgi:uncharacterized protein DUF4129